MLTDPHQIVVNSLTRLQDRLAERDLDGAVDCFVPNGAIYGEDLCEEAHGAEELANYLGQLLDRPYTFCWDLDESWVRQSADTLWFVADARIVLRGPDGGSTHEPVRMSGILRGGGGYYRFELFNGTQPLMRQGLRLVAS